MSARLIPPLNFSNFSTRGNGPGLVTRSTCARLLSLSLIGWSAGRSSRKRLLPPQPPGFLPPFVSEPLTHLSKSAEGTEGGRSFDIYLLKLEAAASGNRGDVLVKHFAFCEEKKKRELHLVSTFSLLTREKKRRWWIFFFLTAGWLVAFVGDRSWSRFRHLSRSTTRKFSLPPFFFCPHSLQGRLCE